MDTQLEISVTKRIPKKRYQVSVNEQTYTRLLRRKKEPRESMNSVVNRILDGDINEQPR
jgi:hypothetical protein